MNQYTYFILGIILGLAVAVYYYQSKRERIERRIEYDKRMFSTEKLDHAMQNVVERITTKIRELKRELTEEEKNDIIAQCCKEKFYLE